MDRGDFTGRSAGRSSSSLAGLRLPAETRGPPRRQPTQVPGRRPSANGTRRDLVGIPGRAEPPQEPGRVVTHLPPAKARRVARGAVRRGLDNAVGLGCIVAIVRGGPTESRRMIWWILRGVPPVEDRHLFAPIAPPAESRLVVHRPILRPHVGAPTAHALPATPGAPPPVQPARGGPLPPILQEDRGCGYAATRAHSPGGKG
ncbi:MAG: hypothetical protein BMS9Abin29_0242 [Gemmatimonadota bacterium]|nr:MAG: hypothetical protein BMS9Abin29_0242 [Gemmatimonadota bacterium]